MEADVPTKVNSVEVIREALRELSYAERKEHRIQILNKNRVTLGNIVLDSAFTPEFVIEKAKALKKKQISTEEYKQLQNALIQGEENVTAFLKVQSIIISLVRDLCSPNPVLQLSAISCCCNIALGNPKACTILTKHIAPYLITELDCYPNYPLLEVCMWTVGNLVAESRRSFEILQAHDCLKYITSLIHNCDSTILASVIYAAVHYVHIGFKHIPENEMVELVKTCTERIVSFENPYFIWLLALLSSHAVCNTYLYNTVPLMLDYLHQNTANNITAVTEITACIRILANTVSEKSGQLAKFLFSNPKYEETNSEMLNRLLSCQHLHVRKETLWLIGNLYNHNCSDVQKIVQDIIPKLSFIKQAVLSTTQQTMTISTDLTI
nr:uncharacterized protein LOC117229740 [Megalopta genalis]XP_033342350.1 uncharacterized protein LOC117229740 [Megalopta genalis]XP_033342351.1 uncharacterized protein LOC117229740 [Megalopta genalis]